MTSTRGGGRQPRSTPKAPELAVLPPCPAARSAAARLTAAGGEPVGHRLCVVHRPDQRRVDPQPGAGRITGGRVRAAEQIEQPPPDQHVLPQRHRPDLVDHHGQLTADLGQPGAELLGVGHRGRQADHLHVGRQVQDDLLPHRPAELVRQVVDLVHHHMGQTLEVGRPGVQHVPQHLGGHHHHRGVRVDRGVAGQQADPVRTVLGDQIGELLVRQCLDRGGVEALTAGGQCLVDGELADDGLAGPGRCANQHAVPVLQRAAGVDLERIEGERPGQGELGQMRIIPAVRCMGESLRRGHVRFVGPTVSRHQSRVDTARQLPGGRPGPDGQPAADRIGQHLRARAARMSRVTGSPRPAHRPPRAPGSRAPRHRASPAGTARSPAAARCHR